MLEVLVLAIKTEIWALSFVSSKGQAIAVMIAPAVAPAAPKQATVAKVG